jgi:hypothetical protein
MHSKKGGRLLQSMVWSSRKVSPFAELVLAFDSSSLAPAPSQAEIHLKLATEHSAKESDIASISWLSSGIDLEATRLALFRT